MVSCPGREFQSGEASATRAFLVEIADVTVHRKELRLRSKSIRPSFVSIRSNSKFGLNQSLCILRLS